MSLVDVQPSTLSELKDRSTPATSAAFSVGGIDGGVGRQHREHRRHVRSEHRRALCHAADREAVAASTTDSLRTVSVVRMASAASMPPPGSAVRAATSAGDAAADRVHRQPVADEAGRADEHVVGAAPELGRDRRAHLLGVGDTGVTRGGVGVAAVEHDGRGPTARLLEVSRA